MYKLQRFHPSLEDPNHFDYLIIPYFMEWIFDNCLLPINPHRLNRKSAAKSTAQHQTLRGRKHIYKNIIGSDSGCLDI
jgi:hypothetical protein